MASRSRVISHHYGNGGLENPWSLIRCLVAPAPQVCSAQQRTCFVSPVVGRDRGEVGQGSPSYFPGVRSAPSLAAQRLGTTLQVQEDAQA